MPNAFDPDIYNLRKYLLAGFPQIKSYSFSNDKLKTKLESMDCHCPGHFASEGHRVGTMKQLIGNTIQLEVQCSKCREKIILDTWEVS